MKIYEPGEVVSFRGFIDWELNEDNRELPYGIPNEVEIVAIIGEDDTIEQRLSEEFHT